MLICKIMSTFPNTVSTPQCVSAEFAVAVETM